MSFPIENGTRYGRLVVVQYTGRKRGKFRLYECLCDCGNTVDVPITLLSGGSTRSCGCLLRESRSAIGKRNLRDIAGMRSGRLVAVRISEQRDRQGRVRWHCRCDCGNETTCRPSQITGQTLVSCGCAAGHILRSPELRAASNLYQKTRRATDVRYALTTRMGNRIREALKNGKHRRSWETLVGYTAADLEKRLRKTMPAGYDWSDFLSGGLHIDHIIPISAHNYKSADDPDFRRAWALTNLQLLPAQQNMHKHTTLAAPFQPSFTLGGT